MCVAWVFDPLTPALSRRERELEREQIRPSLGCGTFHAAQCPSVIAPYRTGFVPMVSDLQGWRQCKRIAGSNPCQAIVLVEEGVGMGVNLAFLVL